MENIQNRVYTTTLLQFKSYEKLKSFKANLMKRLLFTDTYFVRILIIFLLAFIPKSFEFKASLYANKINKILHEISRCLSLIYFVKDVSLNQTLNPKTRQTQNNSAQFKYLFDTMFLNFGIFKILFDKKRFFSVQFKTNLYISFPRLLLNSSFPFPKVEKRNSRGKKKEMKGRIEEESKNKMRTISSRKKANKNKR
ncbi:hypothetical protein BpHYR1_033280 [Brachionus plicatilis]|uniref:Uncharacterized protein n=1 Tax=Brachionus plicatilis TaxID=10195 RepID=A0A3M7R794_BRAPC|nr:hypothetical protein BpHYR1_033280 [Brachionus plicatilis]